MHDASKRYAYSGAREHYILDIDKRDFYENIVQTIEPLLRLPKSKKKRLVK